MKLVIPMLVLLAAGPACAGPLRDPFVRPVAPAALAVAAGAAAAAVAADAAVATRAEPLKPHLRAILFARDQALADINGQVLREGDWIGDWRIAKIEERRVNLKRGADNLLLLLDREKAQ